MAGMRVDLLGPLRVERDGLEVAIGAAKERSLLAAMALSPSMVLSAEALIGALWGERPPASARKTLQTYVSNLRRALGDDAIETAPAGYRLAVGADDVDVSRFRRLVREGDDALRSGSADASRRAFRDALALWRGEPLAGVASHSGIAGSATRLNEEYLSALEARVAADLAAGCHDALVGELEELTGAHRFRERLWGYLMLALYRAGRQADALAAFQRARALLVDELGLEPGGELRRLEQAILRHDPALDAPGQPSALSSPGTRHTPIGYAVCADGVNVAYQVVGDGPVDILVVPGFVSHLDMWWNAPTDHLVRRLASFSRLILFDKRGMGLSDRPPAVNVEHWVEDAAAVLDAAGSTRAFVLGVSAGAPTAALFAATHPGRTQALVLYGGYARLPIATEAPGDLDAFVRHMATNWGTGAGLSRYAPARAREPEARDFWARYQRMSASPTAAAVFFEALARIDVRHVLSAIGVPTLVLHPVRDQMVPVECARELVSLIPRARLVELDSDIHLIWLSDVIDVITTEIEAFIDEAALER